MGIYEEYFKNERGLTVFKQEDAFLTYYVKDTECHIEDLYVAEEVRGEKRGLGLVKDFESMVLSTMPEVEFLSCYIDPEIKSISEVMKLLGYYVRFGFVIVSARENKLQMFKSLKGGSKNV